MRLPFVKMSGAGNDFVIIEHDRVSDLEETALSGLARTLCRRRFAVGADGLITVCPLGGDRVRMVYYNADGTRAEMCGNGARCAARYAFHRGWTGEALRLEADDGSHEARVMGTGVRLRMVDPVLVGEGFEMAWGPEVYRGVSLNTGVPHLVLWVEEVAAVDVESAGRAFRHDSAFAPEGTNVNFVQILAPSVLALRTYERGVEGETLACGTGVVAAAVAAALERGARSPVEARAAGGTLTVRFQSEGEIPRGITLEGDARIAFEGHVDLGEIEDALGLREAELEGGGRHDG